MFIIVYISGRYLHFWSPPEFWPGICALWGDRRDWSSWFSWGWAHRWVICWRYNFWSVFCRPDCRIAVMGWWRWGRRGRSGLRWLVLHFYFCNHLHFPWYNFDTSKTLYGYIQLPTHYSAHQVFLKLCPAICSAVEQETGSNWYCWIEYCDPLRRFWSYCKASPPLPLIIPLLWQDWSFLTIGVAFLWAESVRLVQFWHWRVRYFVLLRFYSPQKRIITCYRRGRNYLCSAKGRDVNIGNPHILPFTSKFKASLPSFPNLAFAQLFLFYNYISKLHKNTYKYSVAFFLRRGLRRSQTIEEIIELLFKIYLFR